jgi:hypothetical protein
MTSLTPVQSNAVHTAQRSLEIWSVMSEHSTLTPSKPMLSRHRHALFAQSVGASMVEVDSHERTTSDGIFKRLILTGFHRREM